MLKPGERTLISTRNPESRGNMMEMEGITGIKGIKELNYKLMYIASNIIVENNSFNEEVHEQEEEEHNEYAQKQHFNEQ